MTDDPIKNPFWTGIMAFGLGTLRLAPNEFWAMTPRELAGAAKPYLDAMDAAPKRLDLSTLMARFPD